VFQSLLSMEKLFSMDVINTKIDEERILILEFRVLVIYTAVLI
jgi:hypothetical protein